MYDRGGTRGGASFWTCDFKKRSNDDLACPAHTLPSPSLVSHGPARQAHPLSPPIMVPRIRLPSSCSRLAALPSSSPSPSSSLFASSRRSLSTTPSYLALITYPPRPQTSHSGSPAAFAAENPVKFPKSVLDRPQPYSPLAIDPMQNVGSLYSRAGIRVSSVSRKCCSHTSNSGQSEADHHLFLCLPCYSSPSVSFASIGPCS
jgi:hypothetical protein